MAVETIRNWLYRPGEPLSTQTTPRPPAKRRQSTMEMRREKANTVGLMVTDELKIAVEQCKERVRGLAEDCKLRNRRFRDIEFDLIEDKDRCLHGLNSYPKYDPADVRRAGDILDNPKFFDDGATANDIAQGEIEDCWFLSALTIISTAGLIEQICVARDERVGIYGFIFWRDSGWVDVVIDEIRNPWGIKEWEGRWSDGSKEWNEPWTADLLKILNYKFGDDGEFVQEYDDFLKSWGIIERCRLFGAGWQVGSQWLKVTPSGSWTPGDVSFTIEVAAATEAVIVLAQLDGRYFQELHGPYRWDLDFTLFKKGDKRPIGYSQHSALWGRSVKLERKLEPGEYTVQVRIDRMRKANWKAEDPNWDERKLERKRTEQTQSQSIAVNFNAEEAQHLPIPPDIFNDRSLTDISFEALNEIVEHRKRHAMRFGGGPQGTSAERLNGQSRDAKPKSGRKKTVEFRDRTMSSDVSSAFRLRVDPAPDEASSSGSAKKSSADASLERTDESGEEESDEEEDEEGEEGEEEDEDGDEDEENENGVGGHSDAEGSPPRCESPLPMSPMETLSPQQAFPGSWMPPSSTPLGPLVPSPKTSLDRTSLKEKEKEKPEPEPKPRGPSIDIGEPVRKSKSGQQGEATGYTCVGCKEAIYGVIYRCVHPTCLNYHVCGHCHRRAWHHPDHMIMELKHPEDVAAVITQDACEDQGLIVGLRVYTKTSRATVTGHLRIGTLLRQYIFKSKVL
ncbi:hypothetical protein FRB99_003163 [Tulasnella sp. 403]|nr:hypothetical protein FRB99_003163 [Tulasnella sp. 403]